MFHVTIRRSVLQSSIPGC